MLMFIICIPTVYRYRYLSSDVVVVWCADNVVDTQKVPRRPDLFYVFFFKFVVRRNFLLYI